MGCNMVLQRAIDDANEDCKRHEKEAMEAATRDRKRKRQRQRKLAWLFGFETGRRQ